MLAQPCNLAQEEVWRGRALCALVDGETRAVRAGGGGTTNLSCPNSRLRAHLAVCLCASFGGLAPNILRMPGVAAHSQARAPPGSLRSPWPRTSASLYRPLGAVGARCPRLWPGELRFPATAILGATGYEGTLNGHALRASRLRREPTPGVAGRSPVKPTWGYRGPQPLISFTGIGFAGASAFPEPVRKLVAETTPHVRTPTRERSD